MRVAIIGDGLLANLIQDLLVDRQLDCEIVWFRGLNPTIPPVSLLHRHVGRSFETDDDRDVAWQHATQYLKSYLDSPLTDPFGKIVNKISMLRPCSLDSRLFRSFESHDLPHVQRVSSDAFPFLAPTKAVFRYDDAYSVNVHALVAAINNRIEAHQRDSTNSFSRTDASALRKIQRIGKTYINQSDSSFSPNITRDAVRPGWRLTDIHGATYDCDKVIFACGCATSHWFPSLGTDHAAHQSHSLRNTDKRSADRSPIKLEIHPGELILADRPPEYPENVAVSRKGHVVPSVCGRYIAVGATYLHAKNEWFPEIDRRTPDHAAPECLLHIKKAVPCLNLITNPKVWYGSRAVAHPDRRPIVGLTDCEDVLIATGLASKGMFWGPVAASSVVAILANNTDMVECDSISSCRLSELALLGV